MTHLLAEGRTEGLQVRFEESNVAAHYTEVRNLLSLYPEIDGLCAYTQVDGCVAHGERNFFVDECQTQCASIWEAALGEVLWVHAYL